MRRLLIALSQNPTVKDVAVGFPPARRVVDRFVPGESIEDAVGAKASNTGVKYANPTIDPYDVLPIAKSDFRAGYGEITVSSNSADIKLTSVPPALAVELARVITNTLKAYVARTAK